MWRDTAPGMAKRESSFNTERKRNIKKGRKVTVKEGWPAAAAVELCGALVKRRLASRARIDSGRLVILVLARPSSLGALHPDHPELQTCDLRKTVLDCVGGRHDGTHLFGAEDRPPFLLGFGLASVGHLSNGHC